MNRMGFIGSSDIAAVMGLSKWKTPLKLWAEKCGEVEKEEVSDKPWLEWGHRHEPTVAKKFADKNGVKLMAYKKRFSHGKYPFLQCELDRIITGTDEMVECKTSIIYNRGAWEAEEIPIEYILQVNFALGISKRKVGWIAVLIGLSDYREKKIVFDQDLFDQQVDAAVKFMDLVEKKEPPAVMYGDKDVLNEIFPESKEEILDVSDEQAEELDQLLEERNSHLNIMKDVKKEIELTDSKIKELLGEKDTLLTGKYKVTWKTQVSRRADLDKMREAGIFEEYSKESKSRVFRTLKKKEKKS